MHIDYYEGYQIKPHLQHPKLLIIVTDGKGGKVPNSLAGMFTSTGRAKREIDTYVSSRAKKETTNGTQPNETSTEG